MRPKQSSSPALRSIFSVLLVSGWLVAAAWAGTETVLVNFTGPNGGQPWAELIFDQAGNLYGTASVGGAYKNGIVFELSPSKSGWKETILHSFRGDQDGSMPVSNVAFDSAGNLYGTTAYGGANGCGMGCGTVFKLSPVSKGWKKTILYSFNGNVTQNGENPGAAITIDRPGNLYSTMYDGGSSVCVGGCGLVYKLNHDAHGWHHSVIYTFCPASPCLDGAVPSGDLTLDAAGNLYGTTLYGGAGTCQNNGPPGCGTAFRLSPSKGGWQETVLYSFTGGTDGSNPYGDLVPDASGNLYGTNNEIVGWGSIFELQPSKGDWKLKVLYNFDGKNGQGPQGPLVFDNAGDLYGTTTAGGPGDAGVIFKLLPTNGKWNEKVLFTFPGNGKGGASPYAGVVRDRQGSLYGTTNAGGTIGFGVVFQVIP
jgi:uncharacterized repeat protein (TIGR03803 family)